MLELFDIAIAFAAVMLAVSLIIMSATQAVSSLLALRGARLRRGLEELIAQTVPSLKARSADLSRRILAHPLISDTSTVLGGRWRYATTIKREELLSVLDAVLKEQGIREPAADELERIEAWFESFMTRVSQWYAMNARWITVAFAIAVTFGLHFDTVAVVKQLSAESETRIRVATMAEVASRGNAVADAKLTEMLDTLASSGITLSPAGHSWHDWFAIASPHFWGMVASVLFLSLGAPFWFNVLKNLTSLKSAVALKDEQAKDKLPPSATGEMTMFESAGGTERRSRPSPTSLPALPPRIEKPPAR